MSLFDSLLGKVTQLAPKQLQEALPDNFDDVKALAEQYSPQLQQAGSAVSSTLGDLFSSDSDGMIRGEPPAAAAEPGMLDKLKNYFTDDPNSGWYDNYKKNSADEDLVKQAMAGIGSQVADQSVKGNEVAGPSTLEKIYKSALGGLGSAGSAIGGALTSNVLGALAPAAGGVAGYLMSKEDRDRANAMYQNSLNAAGTNIQVGPSASENLQDSQQDLSNRALATNMLTQRAQMGLTPEDLAMFQQARQQADQSYQANQSKIQTDMNRRGMGMSPALLMAQQQQAAQDTARRQADDANKVTQASFQAKQAAAQSLGNLANTNLTNDFNRGLAKANNQDAISKFNAEQQRARAAALVGANQAAGQHATTAANNTATAISGIGAGVGAGIGAYNANKK